MKTYSYYFIVKRVIDILFALLALFFIWPIFAIIAIAIKFDSPGPIIFKQERVGKNNRNFIIYKFRTMVKDAEAKTGHIWAKIDDPRFTRLGKRLKYSMLDELPQLLNILRGDMSLIGPRPEMSGLIDKLVKEVPDYNKRHSVKPGITGWAQANGYNCRTSFQKQIEYDFHYVDNLSFGLDLKILFRTVIFFIKTNLIIYLLGIKANG